MRTTPRSTRRTTAVQPMVGKENHGSSQHATVSTTSGKKARHRLSTAELARLEDMFKQETHPSRQQKKDLAAELGMDYKTITIWFQNKRQTSKRSQPPVDRLDGHSGRTRSDSCLRAVSSPSHNATLDASGVDPAADSLESKGPRDGRDTITAKAIVKIKPLLNSLNALTTKQRGHSESTETRCEAPIVKDIDPHRQQILLANAIAPAKSSRHDQVAEQEQIKGKSVKWKRMRTLEWACERQTKRRKLSKEAYARLGSEEIQDSGDPNDTRMDSALSLLSLASSTQVGPSKDVMQGASLLLSFKHSWRKKQV